jgi:outer membrane protein assembly factor BamE (lipoprotein component of BamABCDE complex)
MKPAKPGVWRLRADHRGSLNVSPIVNPWLSHGCLGVVAVITHSRFRVIVMLAACIVSDGCAYALMAPVVVDGLSFSHERASDLRAGMPIEEVRVLFGPPLGQAQRGGSLVWTYDVRRQRRECQLLLLGFIPLQPARTDRHTLELTFDTAGLERAVYRERTPDRDVERMLVGGRTGR